MVLSQLSLCKSRPPRRRLSHAVTFAFVAGTGGAAALVGCGEVTDGGNGETGGVVSAAGARAIAGDDAGGTSGCNLAPGAKAGDGINKNIDPLDDANIKFATAGVGMGSWDWAKDVSGLGTISPANTMTLVPVAGGQSGTALHVSGTGLTGWGAMLSAALNGPTSSFDASKYGGVAFYLKGTTNVEEGINQLMILAGMPDVFPGPGSCCADTVPGSECYSTHRVVIDVPAGWEEVKIAWADFKSPTWGLGSTIKFNPNRIRSITFSFNHDSAAQDMKPVSFDVWLDGLRFLDVDEESNVTGTGAGGTGGATP